MRDVAAAGESRAGLGSTEQTRVPWLDPAVVFPSWVWFLPGSEGSSVS